MSPRAPRLWVCKLYYFTNSFGLACLLPFLPLFYAAWGCTKTRVGALGAVRHLVGTAMSGERELGGALASGRG